MIWNEQEIAASAFHMVVLGPELALDSCFMRIWNDPKVKTHINQVIVDEAHCVSQWGWDFCSSYLSLSCLNYVLGSDIPWYLTSTTLHPHILHDALQIIGLPSDTTVYHHLNDRPNIHLIVHVMKHTIASNFDLAFLVPLQAKTENPEWIHQHTLQFLVYCNSCSDTEKTAKFLQSCLPNNECHWTIWFHLGMSETFKNDTIDVYEIGEILGICCTNACGMVSQCQLRSA